MTPQVGSRLTDGDHVVAVTDLADDGVYVIGLGNGRQVDEHRRRITTLMTVDEAAGWERFDPLTDASAFDTWQIKWGDHVKIDDAEGGAGPVYPAHAWPPGYVAVYTGNPAHSVHKCRMCVWDALRPLTDRDPPWTAWEPPPPPESLLTFDQRVMRVVIDDSMAESKLSARQLAAAARCNGKQLVRARKVVEYSDLAEAVRGGESNLRSDAPRTQRDPRLATRLTSRST